LEDYKKIVEQTKIISQLEEVVERQKNKIAKIWNLPTLDAYKRRSSKIVEQTKIISQLEEKVEEQKAAFVCGAHLSIELLLQELEKKTNRSLGHLRFLYLNPPCDNCGDTHGRFVDGVSYCEHCWDCVPDKTTSSTEALVDRLCGGGGDGDEVVELSGKVGDVIGGLFPDMEEFSSLLNAGFHIELEKADLKLRRNIHGLEKLLTQGREYDIGGNPDPDQNRRIMFLVEHTLLTTPAGFKWNWNDASIQRDFVLHREEQQRRGSLFIDGKLPFQYQRMNCPALHRAIIIFMYGTTEWGKNWRNGINSEGLKI